MPGTDKISNGNENLDKSPQLLQKEKLQTQIDNLSQTLEKTDKEKAKIVKEIWPRIISALETDRSTKMWIIGKNNILADFLKTTNTEKLTKRNRMLSSPAKVTQKIAKKQILPSLDAWIRKIEKNEEKSEKNEEGIKNELLKQAELKKQIAKTEASKSEAIKTHELKLKPTEELKTDKQQKEFATKELWYTDEQIKDIQTKYENSSYDKNELSIGQVFSFLQTKQQLKNKNVQEDPFFKDFEQIDKEMWWLPQPQNNIVFGWWPVPAEDMSASAEELSAQAEHLKDLIAGFKTDNSENNKNIFTYKPENNLFFNQQKNNGFKINLSNSDKLDNDYERN